MQGAWKTLIVAVVASLLAVGFVACGGGDDSDSTTIEAVQGEEPNPTGSSTQDEPEGGGGGESDGQSEGSTDANGGSGSFTPKQHDDSGGGSEQFRVKGGDNSIQEFGSEADTSELDEAAAALHNFLDARAEEEWAAACTYLAQNIVESLQKLATQAKQVEDTSCGGILGALTNPAAMGTLRAEAAQADVHSLRVEDDQAFLVYTGLEDTVYAIPMANEDGSWKVAGLAGTPLN